MPNFLFIFFWDIGDVLFHSYHSSTYETQENLNGIQKLTCDFCRLLVTFANSLDPDQAWH